MRRILKKAPHNLRCEYTCNPLGLDVRHPRLFWQLNDPRCGACQSAYQIVTDNGWDTGRVRSDQTTHIPYAGPPLQSRQRVRWKVRAWDAAGKPSPWSAWAAFEMGLLDRSEWVAQWIGGPLAGGPRTTSPCPFLRKTFAVREPIHSARLYVTALGVYEFHLNGQRVGKDEFRPGWTDYRTRVQYDVYDVTDLLRGGRNCAGAILGDGWYCGHIGPEDRQQYGDRPRLLAQLVVNDTVILATDGTWKTAVGPILESDTLMGESYDARRELPSWNKPAYDDRAWWPVLTFPDPGIKLVARLGPPVRAIQEIKPVAKPVEARGLSWGYQGWVFDLGQNMVGRVRLKVRAKPGTTIRLRHAEMLDKGGKLYVENLRTARATDYFTTDKEGVAVFEPRFAFHGFRYVEMASRKAFTPLPDAVTGVVLHSDMPVTGEFECSDPLLNQLQHNIQWGQRGNYFEVPTDCPQRDERFGWTGDAQIFIRTGAFNFDVSGFFTKWQQDMADAQCANGKMTLYAPSPTLPELKNAGWESPGFADALVICAWTIYRCYGDSALLAQHYESLQRLVEHLRRHTKVLIRSHPDSKAFAGFGDWLALDGGDNYSGRTSRDLIGTAYFAYSARLLSRIAGVLGQTEDAARYEKLFAQIRRAFQKRFVGASGFVAGATQTGYVMALHFDLLPQKLRPAAVKELVRDIENRGNKLSTGFLGTAYLPYALSDNGRIDVACRLLFQKEWPSWLYAVTQGATTIWERWDGWTADKGFQDAGMNSFNHYAYGAIGEWLYARVAGIEIGQPGYKHILIAPQPGGGLKHARAKLRTLHGEVESRWRIVGKRFKLDVTVPANTTATVTLPGQPSQNIGAGRYSFAAPLKAALQ